MNASVISKPLRSFLVICAILTIIGIVMVYSASYIYAKENFGDSAYFFKRQLVFAALGVFGIFLIQASDFYKLLKRVQIMHIIAIVLLIGTFIDGLGIEVKGARRWLDLGITGIQPGEFVKYTISLVAISYFNNFNYIDNKKKNPGSFAVDFPANSFYFTARFWFFYNMFNYYKFYYFFKRFP